MTIYTILLAGSESGECTILFRSATIDQSRAEGMAARLNQKYGGHHHDFFVVEDEVGDDYELPDEHLSDDDVMSPF